MPHVELKNISKQYASAGGNPVDVLKGLNFTLNKGETAAIHGPSGSGKSTLLNLIGGLDSPDTGEISVGGKDISKFSEDQLAEYRNKNIGFVFQLHHLLPQCTLLENILLPSLAANGSSDKAEARAKELMNKLGITERSGHFPSELSGGERLRTAVARALINEPELLLADEPTGSLDEDNASKLADLLLDINKSMGLTLILVTHSSSIAERMQMSYRIQSGRLDKQ